MLPMTASSMGYFLFSRVIVKNTEEKTPFSLTQRLIHHQSLDRFDRLDSHPMLV